MIQLKPEQKKELAEKGLANTLTIQVHTLEVPTMSGVLILPKGKVKIIQIVSSGKVWLPSQIERWGSFFVHPISLKTNSGQP